MGNGDKSARTIEGWVIQYGKPSTPVVLPSGRSVYEVILKDAFVESVNAINAGQATIKANIEHVDDALCRIGLSSANVKVQNRPEGVYASINLMGDSISDDIFQRVKAGIVTGLSVEFTPSPADAEPAYTLVNGNYLRQWSKLNLTGFAITAGPLYPDAKIVAATDGATFTRSKQNLDIDRIAADIAKIESQAAAEQRRLYEYEAFLLGIRP